VLVALFSMPIIRFQINRPPPGSDFATRAESQHAFLFAGADFLSKAAQRLNKPLSRDLKDFNSQLLQF